MSAPPAELRAWPRDRRWAAIALVLLIQLGLLFWLGQRGSQPVRAPASAPTLRVAGDDSTELLALNDPTLFALPHREGFSGSAWLNVPPQEFRPVDWYEAPRWLSLAPEQLGTAFSRLAQTNGTSGLQTPARLEPALTLPAPQALPVFGGRSRMRLAGPLAERELRAPVTLGGWTNADLLTNTVVQLLVDADGRPVSITLLSSSGLPHADQAALDSARSARFAPAPRGGPRLAWGEMVFEWQTLPVPPTNAPARGT